MVGRLVDTELPVCQRQGEINPDQIQCDFSSDLCSHINKCKNQLNPPSVQKTLSFI